MHDKAGVMATVQRPPKMSRKRFATLLRIVGGELIGHGAVVHRASDDIIVYAICEFGAAAGEVNDHAWKKLSAFEEHQALVSVDPLDAAKQVVSQPLRMIDLAAGRLSSRYDVSGLPDTEFAPWHAAIPLAPGAAVFYTGPPSRFPAHLVEEPPRSKPGTVRSIKRGSRLGAFFVDVRWRSSWSLECRELRPAIESDSVAWCSLDDPLSLATHIWRPMQLRPTSQE